MDHATIERARTGDWEVILTPNLPVPRAWFGEVRGRDVLCIASGGGQLAAGFLLTALYEDGWSDDITPLNRYTPMYLATRTMKPA